MGNRRRTVIDGTSTAYAPNNINGYASIGGTAVRYDANGSVLEYGGHSLAYNAAGKLSGADDATYAYDAFGRRVSKSIGSTTTTYCYAGSRVIAEYVSGKLKRSYVNDEDEGTLAVRGDKDTYYYHANHLGSTVALTNGKGAVVERVAYDAFGAPTFLDSDARPVSDSPTANDRLFAGSTYDAESGTIYMRARTMLPEQGRFAQKDPLGYVDGLNDYAYCANSPANFVDPYGTDYFDIYNVHRVNPVNPIQPLGSQTYRPPQPQYGCNVRPQGGQPVPKSIFEGMPRSTPSSFNPGATAAASKEAEEFAKGMNAVSGKANGMGRNLGIVGGIIAGGIVAYNGYQDGYSGTGYWGGLVQNTLNGTVAGAKAGAAFGATAGAITGGMTGAAAGGIGLVPGIIVGGISGAVTGAVNGAVSGAITGAVGYTVGYIISMF
jgi:RHS repeat-associated protein